MSFILLSLNPIAFSVWLCFVGLINSNLRPKLMYFEGFNSQWKNTVKKLQIDKMDLKAHVGHDPQTPICLPYTTQINFTKPLWSDDFEYG